MAADKLVLDLTLVLPHVPDERDACVVRLIALLKSSDIGRQFNYLCLNLWKML